MPKTELENQQISDGKITVDDLAHDIDASGKNFNAQYVEDFEASDFGVASKKLLQIPAVGDMVPFITGESGNLDNPVDTFWTPLNYIPCAYMSGAQLRLAVGDYTWYNSSIAVNTTNKLYALGTGATYGTVKFYVHVGGTAWSAFAGDGESDENIYNGLKTWYLPRTGNETTNGGSFSFYYHHDAWKYAFYNTLDSIVFSTGGAVYKNSISEANLVVTEDGRVGPAGGGGWQGSVGDYSALITQAEHGISYADVYKFIVKCFQVVDNGYENVIPSEINIYSNGDIEILMDTDEVLYISIS